MSKQSIINEILEYVFENYKYDAKIRELEHQYYQAEEKLAKKRGKQRTKEYVISKEVRDFLEPFVDAEYYKLVNYTYDFAHDKPIYKAMQQLKTREYQKFLENQQIGETLW